MDHLLERVHAGVGAPGTRGGQARAGKLLEGDLQLVLHGLAVGLFLVPVPGCAVVLHTQGDPPGHTCNF